YGPELQGVWPTRRVSIASLTGAASLDSAEDLAVSPYNGGESLAVVANDVVYFGTLADIESGKVRSVGIERLQEDSLRSREQEKGAPPPKAAEFVWIRACQKSRPSFLAYDKNDSTWLLTVVEDSHAYAYRLLEQRQISNLSVAPDSGRY